MNDRDKKPGISSGRIHMCHAIKYQTSVVNGDVAMWQCVPERPGCRVKISASVLELEFLFERHDQFNQIERVSIEILNERSAGNDLAFFNAKLVNDNLFEPFSNGSHYFTSLSAFGVGG
jgi:hypothetical protein